MRIKLEYIEVQMLLSGLEAIHLPSVTHHEIKKKLHRRLERMERDYTSGYADNPVNAKTGKTLRQMIIAQKLGIAVLIKALFCLTGL